MSRVTPQTSTPSDTQWLEDHWYPVKLHAVEIEPKGTPGYKGQPTKHNRMILTWEVQNGTGDWVFDWINCTVSPQRDGTPADLTCAKS